MKRKLLIKTAMALALLLGAVGVQADLPEGQVTSLQGQSGKRQSGEQVVRQSSRFVQSTNPQAKERPARVLELRAEAAESPTLIGYVYSGGTQGMYSIPTDGSTSCTLLSAFGSDVKAAVMAGSTYYTTSQTGNFFNMNVTHNAYNAGTWDAAGSYTAGKAPTQVASASAYNPVDGKVYCFYNGDSYFSFGTIDFAGTTVTNIKQYTNIDSYPCAMAITSDGTIYAIKQNGSFCKVALDGTISDIAGTEISSIVNGGAAIHPTTGDFYYATYNRVKGNSELYKINVATAAVEVVTTFANKEQFVGLSFTGGGGSVTPPTPTPVAPGAVIIDEINFPAGSTDGTVTFTMPSTYIDDTPATGSCNYTIMLGGRTWEGTANFGEQVTKDIYVDDFGEYNCMVWASNEAGDGMAATANVNVAAPVLPGAVSNLTANFTDGNLTGTISFDMPNVMADGSAAPADGMVMFQMTVNDPSLSPMGDMSTYGQHVELSVTLSDYGTYTCTVLAMNQGGPGAETSIEFTVNEATAPVVAPGKAENLTANFTDGNLTGTVSFDMPAAYADGTVPAAGTQVFYNLSLQDSEGVSLDPYMGMKEYGGHVDQEVTLPDYGTYTYNVTIIDYEHELTSETATGTFTVTDGTVTPPPTPAGSYKLVGYSKNKANASGWEKALYSIPTDGTPDLTLIQALDAGADVQQAFLAGDTYYTTIKKTVNYVPNYHHVPFAVGSWTKLGDPIVGDKSQYAKALTYYNGKIYGIFSYNYTLSLCTLDIADGASTLTSIVSGGDYENVGAAAMAAAPDGTAYLIEKNGNLKSINLTDGALTDIGSTGITAADICSAAIDPATGTLYYAAFIGDKTSLYTIDTATAAATKVVDFTGIPQIVGLAFIPEEGGEQPAVPTAAPAMAENFSVVFDNGLEGTATFTVPTVLKDGTPWTEGKVKYDIYIAEGHWTGEAAYGETVTAPVSVASAGDYMCFVMLTNEAGESDQAMLTGVHAEELVEPVAPGKAENLTANFTDGNLTGTVSFDMPTALADGTAPAEGAQILYNIQIPGLDPILNMKSYGEHVDQEVTLPDYGTYSCAVTIVDPQSELYSESATCDITVKEATVTPSEPAQLVGYFVSPTGGAPGVYSIPTDGTTSYTMIKNLIPDVSSGVLAGDKYYVSTLTGNYFTGFTVYHKGYNTSTWEMTGDYHDESERPDFNVPYAAAYNPTDGKIYAITIDGDYNNVFGTFDYATGTMSEIIKRHSSNNQSEDFYAMAIDLDGTIYAFRGNGKVFAFDKTTGEKTEKGSTGLSFGGKGGAIVDPATGILYLTNNNELYTIDKATWAATKVAKFENAGRIVGLGMLSSEAPAPVPSPVENLAVNFEGESLTGTVTFNTPTTLVDGTEGTGTLTYEVRANDSLVATAATGFGQSVTANVTLPESGEYEFAVTVYNEAGTSAAVKLTQRVGAIPLSGIIPPYLNTFDSANSVEDFTLLNLNEDQLQWTYDNSAGRFYMGYNIEKSMNAWMITPAVNLEAGKLYEVSIDAYCGNSAYPERVALKLGTEPTPEAMLVSVAEPTDVTTSEGVAVKGYVVVNTSGQYYLGIHGCSDKDEYRLYIDNLSISAPLPATRPAAVTELQVSNPARDFNATVSMKAPAVDIAGNALTALDKVELRRGEELINTFENPTPGAVLTYNDVVPANGTYTYTATASNADGTSPEASLTVYVGTPLPSSPTNPTIKETETEGEVTITWEAPATDKDGRPLDPSIVTYDIVNTQDPNATIIAADLTATSYTFRAVSAGMQDMVQYAIFAKTSAGYAENPVTTQLYPVGKAYEMPVSESFAGGDVVNEFIWGNASYPGYNTWWELCTVDNGLIPQDNDNGYICSFGYAVGDKAALYFGKIAVSADAVNPTLSYWYYKAADGDNKVEAFVDAGEGPVSLQEVVCGPEEEGWKRAIVPLDAYKGKNIRLSLVTTVSSHTATPIDNISVFEYPEKNLKLNALTVASSVNAGNDIELSVNVTNVGKQAINAYSVELFRDGESFETKEFTAIQPDAFNTVKFSVPTDMASASTISLKAVINCADDTDARDNSAEATVTVILPTYPVPTDLAATYSGENVSLTWTAPVATAEVPKAVTESFEEFESFAINPAGDWTFYDQDDSDTWGFADVSYPNPGAKMAFMVYDHSQYPSQMVLTDAHTGDKHMTSVAAKSAVNDDWMITPELYGCAQNVSFYARAVQPAYPEVFEVYYSTTGKELADFSNKLDNVTKVPGEWTKYQYSLPEGAKYLAIRYIGNNCLGFSVDDVEYIPVDAEMTSMEVLGYNVYRNGSKVNTELVAETAYNDVTTVTTDTEYFVTAVYELGESAASNKAKPTSGIDSAYSGDINITAGRGTIIVTGAVDTNVAVYTTAGYALYNEQGAETTIIRTEPGVYIVKAGARTAKVVVK